MWIKARAKIWSQGKENKIPALVTEELFSIARGCKKEKLQQEGLRLDSVLGLLAPGIDHGFSDKGHLQPIGILTCPGKSKQRFCLE